MATCANVKMEEIRSCGKALCVPSTEICGRTVIVMGKRIKTAEIKDETVIEGVTIEDEVFIGHGVIFINDKYPRATNANGTLQTEAEWQVVPTVVKRAASVGSGATIICGVTIGERAIVGAGALVTKDVQAGETVAGNPARVLAKTKPFQF